MAWLIASGQIAWIILALTALELAAFALARRWRLKLRDVLPNVLAGDGLLLAWGLAASHWRLAAAALLGALLAHGSDLWRRSG